MEETETVPWGAGRDVNAMPRAVAEAKAATDVLAGNDSSDDDAGRLIW